MSAVLRIQPNGIKRSCRAIYDIQRRLAAITRTRKLTHQLSSFWLKLMVINLAADYWEDFLEHQLGRRSLGRLSRLSIWPPIIGKTFSNINLGTDHWEDLLNINLAEIIGRNSGTSFGSRALRSHFRT
ncbi:hypothetical protein BLOT_014640 [Blomia tropicalis]|nr:hypothetical protein BLOT_014640 [Blomia tropicalis]